MTITMGSTRGVRRSRGRGSSGRGRRGTGSSWPSRCSLSPPARQTAEREPTAHRHPHRPGDGVDRPGPGHRLLRRVGTRGDRHLRHARRLALRGPLRPQDRRRPGHRSGVPATSGTSTPTGAAGSSWTRRSARRSTTSRPRTPRCRASGPRSGTSPSTDTRGNRIQLDGPGLRRHRRASDRQVRDPPGPGNAPSSRRLPRTCGAQAPGQVNTMWILDVDGTRLQILSGYPPAAPRSRTGRSSTRWSRPSTSAERPGTLTYGCVGYGAGPG